MSHNVQQIHSIAGEAADALAEDDVDKPFLAVC